MNKKIIAIITGALFTGALFTGCGDSQVNEKLDKTTIQSETTNTNTSKEFKETKKSKPSKEEEDREKIIKAIGIQNFEVKGELLPPDVVGNVYYQATVTNNSNYELKNITYKYNYINEDGNKDTTYLSFYDTILNGETSSVEKCFGSDGMDLISVDYQIYNKENGKNIFVEYDVKLGEYSWF